MTMNNKATYDHMQLLRDSTQSTPFLHLDLSRVRENVQTVREAFKLLNPRIHYACKANGDPGLLAALYRDGCAFDVASEKEMQWLEEAGIPLTNAIFSSTIKIPSHIARAHASGINTFAVDNPAELAKLSVLAPRSNIVVRLDVPHKGSRWPLSGKFGVPPLEAIELLRQARELGLLPYGVTFHVGSQCERTESWYDALEVCGKVWRYARDAGIELSFVNLGGGLPATYKQEVPSIAAIGNAVLSTAPQIFGPRVQYAIEPGRFIVADAGTLVTTVIGKAVRNGTPWVFVDLSIYAGLLEVIGGWTYPIVTARDGQPTQLTTLAGPTCDSTDIISHEVDLPEMEVGDRILLLSAGAYTKAYRAYNGFDFPDVILTGQEADLQEAA